MSRCALDRAGEEQAGLLGSIVSVLKSHPGARAGRLLRGAGKARFVPVPSVVDLGVDPRTRQLIRSGGRLGSELLLPFSIFAGGASHTTTWWQCRAETEPVRNGVRRRGDGWEARCADTSRALRSQPTCEHSARFASWPALPGELGPDAPARGALAAACADPAPLAQRALRRSHPTQEPGALAAHTEIGAGGGLSPQGRRAIPTATERTDLSLPLTER